MRRDRVNLIARGTVYGALWGVSITASEMLVLPLGRIGSSEQLFSIGWIFAGWLWKGVAIGCLVVVLEPRLDRAWKTALLVGAVSLAAGALSQAEWQLFHLRGERASIERRLGDGFPSWGVFFYNVYMTLFHGGIFVVACVVMTRTGQSRHWLAAAQIARDRHEIALDLARLDALRGQIDPDFLWRAVAAIQSHYAARSGEADRLLDRLVGFLRDAMPGVRSGRSTLAAEVSLATAYAELRAAVQGGAADWRIDVAGPLPSMPFPPLLLLPLMDHLGAEHPAVDAPRRFVVASRDDGVWLWFHADAPAGGRLPDALDYRLRVTLRALFGDGFQLSAQAVAGPRADAVVALHIEAPHAGVSPVAAAPPDASHAAPWTLDSPRVQSTVGRPVLLSAVSIHLLGAPP